MEKQLLGISLASREDFQLVSSYIDMRSKTYSKEFQVLMSKVGEWYARDGTAENVQPDVIIAQLAETIRSDKLLTTLSDFMSDAVAASFSSANVRAVVSLARQQEVADKLAAALASTASKLQEALAKLRVQLLASSTPFLKQWTMLG